MIEFEFGQVSFTGPLAIGIMNSNICVDEKTALDLFNACLEHYGSQNFAYLSIRNHSYSVDPLVYTILSKLETFKAMAVVVTSDIATSSAGIEGEFLKQPFKIFSNLSEAKLWAQNFI